MPTGTRFPALSALTLAGTNKTLPDAAAGKVALIVIAFVRGAQEMINSWVLPFEEEFLPSADIVVYEVPMIESALWRPARLMIDGGMRSGIPPGKHDYVITWYGSAATYREALGMEDRSLAYIFLLDRDGIIRWEGKGFADSDGLALLLKTASALMHAGSG